MLEIKNISAQDLTRILNLFYEDFNAEKEFVQNAKKEGSTYSIIIEAVNEYKKSGKKRNIIYENVGNNSNEVFFDVYLDNKAVEELKKVGEVEECPLVKVMTFKEATEKWGLSDSTLRERVNKKGFKENDVRKSAGTWLITESAMRRIYGKPNLE